MKMMRFIRSGQCYVLLTIFTLLATTSSAWALPGLDQLWQLVSPLNPISIQAEQMPLAEAPVVGEAILHSTADPTVQVGQVVLVETAEGLHMRGQLANVTPGLHGFHIHEGSSCAGEGSAAGGHFNPYGTGHGHLPSQGFAVAHGGDLGNVEVNDQGQAAWEILLSGLTLSPGELSVTDRTFVLHAQPDDFSQPSGNAGARIACGVIHVEG